MVDCTKRKQFMVRIPSWLVINNIDYVENVGGRGTTTSPKKLCLGGTTNYTLSSLIGTRLNF